MDNCRAALGLNMRAHPIKFGHMHIAVFKYGLGKHASAICHAEHCHKLRLHIGGKTGIRRGGNGKRLQLAV